MLAEWIACRVIDTTCKETTESIRDSPVSPRPQIRHFSLRSPALVLILSLTVGHLAISGQIFLTNGGLNAFSVIGGQAAGPLSLSNPFVVGNNVQSQTSSFFLIGANMRGQAFNPIRDGKLDDWYTYRVQDAQKVRAYGFNAIRLVTYWEYLELSTSANQFSYNASYISKLKQTVQTYNEYGIYVYIDLHEHGSLSTLGKFIPIVGTDTIFGDAFYSDTSPTSPREHLRQLWLTLSGTFKDNPGVIGYGICNEPHHNGPLTDQQIANYWFNIADYIISSLRNVGDNHRIFVNFAPSSQSTQYMSRKLYDNNVVYEVHFYYGINTDTLILVNNDYKWLSTQFNSFVKPNLAKFGVPYVIGELGFGSNRVTPGDGMDVWIRNILTILRAQPRLQGWFYWSYNEVKGAPQGGGWEQTLVTLAPLVTNTTTATTTTITTAPSSQAIILQSPTRLSSSFASTTKIPEPSTRVSLRRDL